MDSHKKSFQQLLMLDRSHSSNHQEPEEIMQKNIIEHTSFTEHE